MVFEVFLFLVGLLVLYYGAEWLIHGASSLALQYGIRPVIVGLTVVALGTSMPEFLVNTVAVWDGEHSLALGNIIGSNISNIALILGASALVLPLAVTPQILRKEYPMMVAAMTLFYLMALDGLISRWDGLILIGCLFALGGYLFYDARRATPDKLLDDIEGELPSGDEEASAPAKAFYVIGGTGGLAFGAHLMVDSAVEIAHTMGVDPAVFGLSVVAIGTSLPELAASMVGAVKSESDLSVGNVLGSNLLNVLFVVGIVSSVSPLSVDPPSLRLHFPVMLGFCVVLLPIAWTEFQISRLEGGFLLIGFFSYMAYLMMPYL
jgi:cation:H+ antiporter